MNEEPYFNPAFSASFMGNLMMDLVKFKNSCTFNGSTNTYKRSAGMKHILENLLAGITTKPTFSTSIHRLGSFGLQVLDGWLDTMAVLGLKT